MSRESVLQRQEDERKIAEWANWPLEANYAYWDNDFFGRIELWFGQEEEQVEIIESGGVVREPCLHVIIKERGLWDRWISLLKEVVYDEPRQDNDYLLHTAPAYLRAEALLRLIDEVRRAE